MFANKTPGTIYIISAQRGPLAKPDIYKVGSTTNLKNRLRTLRQKYKTNFNVIHTFTSDDAGEVEWFIRQLFDFERIDFEWYIIPNEDIRRFQMIDYVPVNDSITNVADMLRALLRRGRNRMRPSEYRVAMRKLRISWEDTRVAVACHVDSEKQKARTNPGQEQTSVASDVRPDQP